MSMRLKKCGWGASIELNAAFDRSAVCDVCGEQNGGIVEIDVNDNEYRGTICYLCLATLYRQTAKMAKDNQA